MADYTYEQYMEAAKNADNAGDEDAARKLVQAAISLKDKTVDKKDQDRKSTRLNSSHSQHSRMPSYA